MRTSRRLRLEVLERREVLSVFTDYGELEVLPLPEDMPVEVLLPSVGQAPLPQLSSDPAATAKLFLDFDGHFEANWGGFLNATTPAFSLDSNFADFSDEELRRIIEIWQRVSEDYAPFKIDVTTIDPGNQTNGVTAVIAIGGSYNDWYKSAAGGVAFVGGFTNFSPNVGYVFADSLGDSPKNLGEASSHEAGHLFGLRHQAQWNGTTLVSVYRNGPIMGNSYSTTLSRWSNGPTNVCSTCLQDDMAVIGNATNAFGSRPDDFADTTPLPASPFVLSGLSGRQEDDVFEFTTTGGLVVFDLQVADVGPNLDAILRLLDASGVVLATSSPSDSFDATISTTLAAGTYRLHVSKDGTYGNVGRYTLSGSYENVVLRPEIHVEVEGVEVEHRGSVDFGTTTQGAAVSRTFEVFNLGEGDLNLGTISVPAGYTLTPPAVSTLASGESVTLTVTLSATSGGTLTGKLLIPSNDLDEGNFEVNLSGRVLAPELTVLDGTTSLTSGASLDFGGHLPGATVTRTLTLKNDGDAALTIDPAIVVPSGFELAAGPDKTTLLPGESTSILLQLLTFVPGSFQGDLVLASSDADESSFTLKLSGQVSELLNLVDNSPVLAGKWSRFNSGFGGQSFFSKRGSGNSALWSFEGLPVGVYEVYATWITKIKLATDAPYQIDGGATVRVNQSLRPQDIQEDGVGWKRLAVIEVTDGTLNVRLTNNANNTVLADAVRIKTAPGLTHLAQALYFSDVPPGRRRR